MAGKIPLTGVSLKMADRRAEKEFSIGLAGLGSWLAPNSPPPSLDF